MTTISTYNSSERVCIINSSDYSPFGVTLDGRTVEGSSYRYSFQGQEKDDEIKGAGNAINYKYRMHDPRVGRFFAIDPLTAKYPHYTPYSFSGNKVIAHVELEGLEEFRSNLVKAAEAEKNKGVKVGEDLSGNDTTEANKKYENVDLSRVNIIHRSEDLAIEYLDEALMYLNSRKDYPSPKVGTERDIYVEGGFTLQGRHFDGNLTILVQHMRRTRSQVVKDGNTGYDSIELQEIGDSKTGTYGQTIPSGDNVLIFSYVDGTSIHYRSDLRMYVNFKDPAEYKKFIKFIRDRYGMNDESGNYTTGSEKPSDILGEPDPETGKFNESLMNKAESETDNSTNDEE